MRWLPWRGSEQPKPIGEAEAYTRSYGNPSEDVRVIKLPPRRPRDKSVLASGELLRQAFLDRMERRRSGEKPPES